MLKFEEIDYKYDDKVLFSGFNLDIKQGQKIVLSGESGIGKTTLFSFALGLSSPDKGNIFTAGLQLNSNNIKEIRQNTAYLPQDAPIGRGQVISIINDIFSFKINRNLMPSEEEVKKMFFKFNLNKEILYKKAEMISGGERQRVALCIALLLKRKVLLLDEPTSALDSQNKLNIINILNELKNITVVVITHDSEWCNNAIFDVFDIGLVKWL